MRSQLTKKKQNGKKKVKNTSQSIPKTLPAAQSKTIRKLGRPQVRPLGRAGDVLVIHKEFVSDIVASATAAAFSVVGIPINPGNSSLFPWLSQIAGNFESYVFRGLKFLFETDAPSTTPGSMLMAVDYEVSDALPADKQELMSRRDSTRSSCWASNALNCTKEDLRKRKSYFVQSEAVAGPLYELLDGQNSGGDARLEDVGELLLASSNSTSSAVLGEMYVEYEVELMTPDSAQSIESIFAFEIDLGISNPGASIANPFGTQESAFTKVGSSNPLVVSSGPWRYTFDGSDSIFATSEAGTYLVNVGFDNWSTTAGNPIVPIFTADSNMTINSRHDVPNAGGATIADFVSTFYVVVTDKPPDVNQDISHLKIHLTGVGISVAAALVSYARFVKVPDFHVMQIGGLVPKPRSCSHHGKKSKAKQFALDSLVGSHLAGNATPQKTGEKESSSDYSESLLSPAQSDVTVILGDIPSFQVPLKRDRCGRFRHN